MKRLESFNGNCPTTWNKGGVLRKSDEVAFRRSHRGQSRLESVESVRSVSMTLEPKDQIQPEGVYEAPEDLSEVMDFSDYDLKTTIRLIVLSGESRSIHVSKGSHSGRIYINCGEILHVVTDTGQGDEALFDLLAWKNETHTDGKCDDSPDPNIRIPTSVFLDILKNN
jgi:hypothetical protein